MKKRKSLEQRRKSLSFKFSKLIIKIISRKPKYLFLGEEFPDDKPYMFIVNHCGKKSPTKLEVYFYKEIRIWGTHEMTEGIKGVHKYLTTTYYHEKKHLPKWFAWIVGTIVTPIVAVFYKGMRLIPTYRDIRFATTIKESIKAAEKNMGIVIFPEDSSKGYDEKIEYFFSGFVKVLDHLKRKGIDMPVYVGYLQKKKNTFVIDKPINYSTLCEKYNNDEEIAEACRIRLNELADYTILKENISKH